MSGYAISAIIDDLERGYDGDAWHGPPLRKVLDGVTAETASARPVPSGHSIWEIVFHLADCHDVVVRRIEERRAIEEPEISDVPADIDTRDTAWIAALSELHRQHLRLIEAASNIDVTKLREPVVGKSYDVGHMLRGVVQHLAYHAGQIALIRKLS